MPGFRVHHHASIDALPDVRVERTYWLGALVALACLSAYVPAEAQIPTTARIRVTGAVHQQRDAYGYFHLQTPDLLVLWVISQRSAQGSVSLQMRHRGAAFLRPGRYPVVRAGRTGPQDPSVFQVSVQQDARSWAMDSGLVTIDSADTLSLSGRVSMRGSRPSSYEGRAPTDTIRVEAQFTLRYDPFTVQLRQLVHERAEPHPPSSGQRPAPRAASPPSTIRPVPPPVPQPDHILEGSMGADGRCVVNLDGRPVISGASRQQYLRDFALNTPVPEGQDWQVLNCGGVSLSFLAPVRKVVARGRYSLVDREFPTVGTFTAVYSAKPSMGTDPFPANLVGRSGVLEIEAADSTRIVGRFRVTAQTKAWWP